MKIPSILKFWRVKFKDWLWFVIVLRGNEFSNKLLISRYMFNPQLGGMKGLIRDRQKAHDIDMKLRSL